MKNYTMTITFSTLAIVTLFIAIIFEFLTLFFISFAFAQMFVFFLINEIFNVRELK